MMGGLEERLSFLMGQHVPVSPPISPPSDDNAPPSPQNPKDFLEKDDDKGKLMTRLELSFVPRDGWQHC